MHDALVRGFNINLRITLCQLFNYDILHEKPGTGSRRLKQPLEHRFALSLPEDPSRCWFLLQHHVQLNRSTEDGILNKTSLLVMISHQCQHNTQGEAS